MQYNDMKGGRQGTKEEKGEKRFEDERMKDRIKVF